MRNRKCAHCGAYLDPGEWCDCDQDVLEVDEQEARRPRKQNRLDYDGLYARHMMIDKEEHRK